jgi:hypothetical protein
VAWITAANWKEHALGHVSDGSVRQDGQLIAAELVIQDDAGVTRIDTSELSEVSMGYTCDFDATPGTSPEGERYDGVQRDIRYNHVALLPPGSGRAGRDVALRLDALDVCDQSVVPREDSIDPDELMRKARARAENAWRNMPDQPRRDTGIQRSDSHLIDPDESMRRSRERNANAWKKP